MRLVLIAIEDNDEADAFVEAVNSEGVLFSKPESDIIVDGQTVSEISWHNLERVAVEAMWQAPTKMCECHPPHVLPNALAKQGTGLTCVAKGRSKKYGWLLCTLCMKPHGFQTIHPKNLLGPEEEDLKDRKFVLGFRTDKVVK